ncbi:MULTISPECIES: hypothetical protein [Streptomyces]|uniref:hypothetical protein n=1 Tax=Streptomyces TaxID=1883 RepID=UPI000315A739|nr:MULTISPECIES: hypothetical protein [Streptomyces]MCC8452851.1 hypothetical protein [Streptomyces rochei]
MTRTPRSIDEALRRARIFKGEYTAADLDAAQQSLARQLHELRWVHLLHTVPGTGMRPHPRPSSLHEQAAHDLQLLCRGTVQHPGAASRITAFDTARDAGGALTFACLLYLAAQEEQEQGAQFWWHYAAGAGSVTAALCVYLLHVSRGELRDARHWGGQIHRLNSLNEDDYAPVDHRARLPCPGLRPASSVRYHLPHPASTVSRNAVKDAVDDVRIPHDSDVGPVPQPIPALADRWEGLVTA